MKGTVLFITGIDTNIGKTFATGMIACALAEKGKKVITQKMIQTGCTEVSEDIEMHRKIQGIPFTEEDKAGLTCPYIFTYPCSPHMAAEKDGKTINLSVITEATRRLQEKYEYVLLEGAGGLMVPNDFHSLAIDYVKEQGYPVILVTSGKLGSINHTLLTLCACKQYGIPVRTVVYNLYPPTDEQITANTLEYLTQYLEKVFPDTALITLPEATAGVADIDLVFFKQIAPPLHNFSNRTDGFRNHNKPGLLPHFTNQCIFQLLARFHTSAENFIISGTAMLCCNFSITNNHAACRVFFEHGHSLFIIFFI